MLARNCHFMLNRLKRHSVKILVFFINILLAAIAAFIIRERDQARLLENSQEKDLSKKKQSGADNPSFKENLNLDSSDGNSEDVVPETQPDLTEQNPPDTIVPSEPIPSPSTVPAVPAPTVKKPAAPDRKTKTS